ncbi:protein translocase subunit SecD [Candidatus Jorgensenbacteria bacterium CG_4_10_14_0_8_um_filter_39_13]|uniref:Protein translocase subunit SecD n=2 Tax=Candidatus Joergenseniibacteriota TaxID=1752739 RepID=A0A2M7RFH7_9BACT|nr:MAG: protein translocase subunit SecD [Candidatus Jorgensenbacteria bacterium CG11_big_fil_rev_8_21_14_0_20_38_23]PIV12970.1 MAG: protein translocase subunit SecD [Candidatus Jorgensenbacteria bacterium CG03_land_8_20_14_0_80_38_39]PIY95489.1 MAG: protein translocase subunit SecD [Candidatus Jorgensenbacteria bacterium CG_4_10_14_0_8_um_filter_39_13]PJA94797.1 MAG: protein translocase subunit SecD [Candidatus Jorgensenbacteria bacterium CG_4_9_14_3_um_filter_38_10]
MFYQKNTVWLLILVIIVAVAAAVFDYQPFWQKISSFRPWTLGLDLAGGSYLIYDIDLSQTSAADRGSVVNGLRDVIEKRVNLFGVSEPKIYTETSGDHSRLVAELAGIKDISQAIKEIGATPFLDFREVQEEGTSTLKFIPTVLTGRYIKSARLGFDSVTNVPQVEIEFTDEGAKIFADLTEKNINKPLAIFLDNNLIEMPTVKEKIVGGKAQITGKFTLEAARQLVERFNAGALPAPITLVNQQTVDASLGQDALQKALLAGLIGTAAIIIFMMAFYGRLGVFASLALLMYISLILGIFKLLPVTMTLAGIAGAILSIGMAVDANVLIFARTREELKKGLSWSAAIEEGFRRAWSSIRDSNISTLITAAILYNFTSGFVRGFALTLFIGVIVSMFSAITVTRGFLKTFILKTKKAD